MFKVIYKPTIVNISQNLRKHAKTLYGEDLASLMIASMKTMETNKAQPHQTSFFKKVFNFVCSKTRLTLNIDKGNGENAVVTAKRKIGLISFEGTPEEFPIESTLRTLKPFKNAVLKSKEGILEDITELNDAKRNFLFRTLCHRKFLDKL